MKIKLYAGGGIAYLPTSNMSAEVAAPSSGAASAASTKAGKNEALNELFSMIKQEGLDTDVSTFLNHVQRTLTAAGDPTGENISINTILQLSREASLVKSNYADYAKARDRLKDQEAWGDVALDSRGKVYVYDNEDNKIKTITLSELKKSDIYTPLTNEELLAQRRSSPELAYNNNVLDDVYRAVGLKTIIEEVDKLIKSFKPTEITGYSVKAGNSIKTGMEEIVDGVLSNGNDIASVLEAGPDGVYKITQESTVADTDLQGALNYIYSALPGEYRRTLEARAVVEGYEPKALLLSMLASNTGRKITPTYEKELTERIHGGGSGGSESMIQHTLAEAYVDGQDLPGLPTRLEITPSGSTSSIYAYAQSAGPVLQEDSGKPGKPLGVASVAQLMEDAYAIRKQTSNTVVFGDQLINEEQLGGLVYDGSDMYRVVLPSKTINGGRDVVPDFELQEKLDAVVQQAMDEGTDAATLNRLIQQICPGARYDEKTGGITLPRDRQHVFLTFGAYAADNYIDFNESKYLTKSDKNVDVYEEAVKYGYANHAKNAAERLSGTAEAESFLGLSWFRGTKKHLYQGNVFLPTTSNAAGSAMYNQEYIPKSSYTNVTGRAMETERQAQVRERLSDPNSTNWGN